jgi:hypothetical protein
LIKAVPRRSRNPIPLSPQPLNRRHGIRCAGVLASVDFL